MPKLTDEPRTCYVQAAVTAEERAVIEAIAEAERQTISTVLRDLMLEALAAREDAARDLEMLNAMAASAREREAREARQSE